jgi:hypothetical protein
LIDWPLMSTLLTCFKQNVNFLYRTGAQTWRMRSGFIIIHFQYLKYCTKGVRMLQTGTKAEVTLRLSILHQTLSQLLPQSRKAELNFLNCMDTIETTNILNAWQRICSKRASLRAIWRSPDLWVRHSKHLNPMSPRQERAL